MIKDLDDKLKKELIYYYVDKDKGLREIMRVFSLPQSAIIKVLKENNIKIRKNGGVKTKVSEEIKQQIINLYVTQKKSTEDVGTIFNFSHTFILKKLREWSVRVRTRGEARIGRPGQEMLKDNLLKVQKCP